MLRHRERFNLPDENLQEDSTLAEGSSTDQIFIEKFAEGYDDSSDEEIITEKNASYNADIAWKKTGFFSRNKQNLLNQDKFLSFIAHAAGLKILYSNEVNQFYYPLKRQILCDAPHEPKAIKKVQTLVEKAVSAALDETLQFLKNFIIATQQNKISLHKLNQYVDTIQTEFRAGMPSYIESNLILFIKWLRSNPSSATLEGMLLPFVEASVARLNTQVLETIPLPQITSLSEKANASFQAYSETKISAIIASFPFEEELNQAGKYRALNLLNEYSGLYREVINQLKWILEHSQARGYVSNILSKKFNEPTFKTALIQAYIKDLGCLLAAPKTARLVSVQERKLARQYFVFSEKHISRELNNQFSCLLKTFLEKYLRHLDRPLLAKGHLFSSTNAYQFYANVRLSERDSKRKGRALRHTQIFASDQVARLWRLSNEANAKADVLEIKEILPKLGHKSLVTGVGSYEKVLEAINQLKDFFALEKCKITDQQIAAWIRTILQGQIPSIDISPLHHIACVHKIQAITLLLFGCEASRNPAMIVISQMILDLIEAAICTWQEVFSVAHPLKEKKQHYFPMAPQGAVAAARALNAEVLSYMPHAYFYPGAIEQRNGHFNKADLIELEAHIVRSWLENIAGVSLKRPRPNLAEWLLALIEEHHSTWLGKSPEANVPEVSFTCKG